MIKYLRYMSDLHLEFAPFMDFPFLETDKNTLLVLAGDILEAAAVQHVMSLAHEPDEDNLERYDPIIRQYEVYDDFLKELKGRFAAIVVVAGNHEFYGSALHSHTYVSLRKFYENYGMVFLQNEVVVFETYNGNKINIFGATLWTDFKNKDPFIMYDAAHVMSDYGYIRDESGMSIRSDLVAEENAKSREALFEAIETRFRKGDINMVVTHHLPSLVSVYDAYMENDIRGTNYLYANTGLEAVLEDNDLVWIHGHTHEQVDVKLGRTRILANPRGYHRKIADRVIKLEHTYTEFDPSRILNIEELLV